jgi:hypothetical protein
MSNRCALPVKRQPRIPSPEAASGLSPVFDIRGAALAAGSEGMGSGGTKVTMNWIFAATACPA